MRARALDDSAPAEREIIGLGDVAYPDFWNEPRHSGDLKACPGTTSRAQSPQS